MTVHGNDQPHSLEEIRILIDLVRVRNALKDGTDVSQTDLSSILDRLERTLEMTTKWAVLSSYDDQGERTAELRSTEDTNNSFDVVCFFDSSEDGLPTPDEFSAALAGYGEGEQEYLLVPMTGARAIKVNVEKRLEVISTGSYL